jgi:shikimate kinase
VNIVLFGIKGCGKSYFGKKLAEETRHLFVDTDLLLEALYEEKYHEHLNFREIYTKLGKERFRQLEHTVIQSLETIENAVISVGGGAIFEPSNRAILEKMATLVYLKVDKEMLKKRIFFHGVPAFLDKEHPEESFEKMYRERTELYEKIPATHISCMGKNDVQILNELKKLMIYGQ